MNLSRRSLLTLGAAGVASTAIPLSGVYASGQWKGKRPKNIIFCVADGMAMQTVSMCDEYQKIALGKTSSYWAALMDRNDVLSGYMLIIPFQIRRPLPQVEAAAAESVTTELSERVSWSPVNTSGRSISAAQ